MLSPISPSLNSKKLAGGGYFKIINQSVPAALKNLNYTEKQIDAIVKYAVGSATFEGAPFINPQTLSEKGFLADEIKKLNEAAKSALRSALCLINSHWVKLAWKDWVLAPTNTMTGTLTLGALGFQMKRSILPMTMYVVTMTVEGAPELKA